MECACANCGKSFIDNYPPSKRRSHCSRACATTSVWKNRRLRPPSRRIGGKDVNCPVCGVSFHTTKSKNSRYCSSKCFGISKIKKQTESVCFTCNMPFMSQNSHHKTKYCSPPCRCIGFALSVRKFSGEYLSRKEAKASITEDVGCCERCGYSAHIGILEIHHKDRDTNNNFRSNLVLLCPNCHSIDHLMAKDGKFSNNIGRRKQTVNAEKQETILRVA